MTRKPGEPLRQWLDRQRMLQTVERQALAALETFPGTSQGRALPAAPIAREGGPSIPAVTIRRGGPAGELIKTSATSDSVASGGDFLTADTEDDRYGFSSNTLGDTYTLPRKASYWLHLNLDWDSYLRGGKFEVQVNGTTVPDGTLDAGGLGDGVEWGVGFRASKGDTVKVKATQSSGSAQAATWTLTLMVVEPQKAIATATWEKVASVDAWGIFNTGTSWWITEGTGRTVTEYNSSWVQQSTFESDVDTEVRGVTVLSGDVWVTGDGEAGAGTDEKVWRYNTAGTLQSSFTTGPDTDTNTGLANDGTDLWVIEAGSAELRKYDTAGTLLTTVNLPGSRNGLTVHGGNLVMVNTTASEIEVRNTSGTLQQTIGAYEIGNPTGVWVAADGTLYVSKDGDGVYKWNEGTL